MPEMNKYSPIGVNVTCVTVEIWIKSTAGQIVRHYILNLQYRSNDNDIIHRGW